MTNRKSTKKALLTSCLALLLCFSMLVGTTFAWFTDSVESGVNKIIAGNLDVDVLTADGNSIKDVTNLFDDVNGEPILWEPGVVAYENITVVNEGNLALKYQLEVNFDNENTFKGYGLSEVLQVAVVEGGVKETDREKLVESINTWQKLSAWYETGALLKNGDSQEYGIVIWWEPSDKDNLWNVNNGQKTDDGEAALTIDLGVKLVATQMTNEEDSFDEKYDEDAFTATTTEADTLIALLAAAQPGDTVEYTLKGDTTVTKMITVPEGVTLKLNGNGYTIVGDMNATGNTAMFYAKNADIHVEDVTFTGSATYAIFTNGVSWEGGNTGASLTNVTVNMTTPSSAYPLNFGGKGNITLNNCTITGEGRSVDNYRNGAHVFAGAEINLTVKGGTIGGVLMNANYGGHSTITLENNAEVGKLILASEKTHTSELINNGGTVNEVIQQVDNGTKLETVLKAGNSAALTCDVTLEGHLSYSAHGSNITIYGGDNTLTLRGIFGANGANVTLSDMTLVDSWDNDYTIYNQGGKVELTNVTYTSNINEAFWLAGGGEVVLTNCNITGEVTGDYAASNIWCGDGRNVTVNGGTYGSIFMNAQYHSEWPGAAANAASKITVNDGTINKLTLETELGADGYYVSATLTQNGGTITELVENPQDLDLTGRTKVN